MKNENDNSDRLIKGIEQSIEGFAWLKLMMSPFLSSLIVGVVLYVYYQTNIALIIAIILTILGLIYGIYFANRIKKKIGAVNHLSKLNKL